MSTALGEPAAAGSQKYVNFDEYVDFQVNKTRAGIRNADLLIAVVMVLLVAAGYLLAFVVADQWIIDGGFGYWPRVAMLAGVCAFLVGWTTWKIILPYWKRVSALYAARELEETQPGLKSSLLTLVDLKNAGRVVSPQILSALEKRAALQLSEVDVEQAVDRRPLMRLAYALCGVVVAFCLYVVLSPKPVGGSLLRALIPVADVGVATRTRIVKVEPGQTTILARSQMEVTVDLEGEIPQEATLLYTTADRSLVDEPVVLRDTGEGLNRFRGSVSGPNGRGLLQDFTYHVTAGDAVSDAYPVRVSQAPYATVESVSLTFPAYMGLDPKSSSGGDIDAWEGTQVTVRAVSNMPVAGALLKMHDTEDTSLKAEEFRMRLVDETHIEHSWTLQFRPDGTFPHYYSIDLRTADGKSDPVPRLYGLTIRRDLPPEIKLLHPSGDIELPLNAVLPIAFAARDPDFMLRSVRLMFEKRDELQESKTRHLYDAPPYRAELQGRSEIELETFDLEAGDVLTFWLEAWDNMDPLGDRPGNRTVTSKINITISERVAAEQVEQQRAEEQAVAQQRLEEAQQQPASEPGEAETERDNQQRDDAGTETVENAAGDSTTESTQTGDHNSGEAQPSDAAGADAAENTNGDATQQPTGEQQSASDQPAPERQPRQGNPQPGGNEAGGETQAGDSQQSRSGNNGRSNPSENGATSSQPSQGRSAPQPGQEASDDEALNKLFEKYRDELQQQHQQQQNGGDGDQSPTGGKPQGERDPSGQNNPQQAADENSSNSPDSPSGNDDRTDETGDRDSTDTQQRTERSPRGSDGGQSATGDDQNPNEEDDQSGNSPPMGDRSENGERPEGTPPGERGNSDPRANQDPRTADENRGQNGARPSPENGDSEQQRNQGTPMPGGGSDSAQPSGENPQQQPSQGNPSPGQSSSAQPSGEKPSSDANAPGQKPADQNASGGDNPSQARPSENADPNQPGDRGGSGSEESPATKPAQTDGQPNGPDDSEPGEGLKNGQRSEQPSAGEQGSSQQASEGTPGGQKPGEGDPSQSSDAPSQPSPGGKPSAGQGQQSSSGGQQQTGGDQQSQAGGEPSDSASESGSDQAGDSPSSDQPTGGAQRNGGKPEGDQNADPQGAEQEGAQPGGGQQGGDQQQGEQPGGSKPEGGQQNDRQSGNENGPQDDAGQQGGAQDGNKPQQGGAQQGESGQNSGEQQGASPKPGGQEAGKPGGQQQGGEQGAQQGGGEQGGEQGGKGGKEAGGKPGSQPGSGQGGGDSGEGGTDGASSAQSGTGQAGNSDRSGGGGSGQRSSAQPPGEGGGGGGGDGGGADPADLNDKKRATELVLRRLQDELSRGDVSPELLKDLGWTEQNLRDFMQRLDQRLSDTGEDQSPEAQARRRQFSEILRGIDYKSEGRQQSAAGGDRPVEAGSGAVPRLPPPSEFRGAEESFQQKKSRETSK